MHKHNAHIREALAWIRAGLERIWREPVRWLGMTLIYLVVALVLKRIPFLGNFVLVLLTPAMLASAMIVARNEARPLHAGVRGWVHALTRDALHELFRVFRTEARSFAIIVVCIVTMGLVVLVNIPELLLTGGSIVTGLAGADYGGPIPLTMILGMMIVIALYVLLAMGLLYVVPLTIFRHHQAIPAVAESFRACVRHRKSLAFFIAPFLGVNLGITIAFGYAHWLGYLLLATLGVIAIPVFVASLHSSYQALFETPAAVTHAQPAAA